MLWEIVAAMTSDLRRQSASDKWRSAPQVCKVHTCAWIPDACLSQLTSDLGHLWLDSQIK